MDLKSFDESVHTVVEPSPSQSEIDRVIGILERAIVAPIPALPDDYSPKWSIFKRIVQRQQRKLLCAAAALLLVSFSLFFMNTYLRREGVLIAALIAAVLAEICALLHVASEMVAEIPFFRGLVKRPHDPFLKMLRITTAIDLPSLRELGTCELSAIHYVHRQSQYHRMGLERRGGAFSGSIDKIGIFPAVAALALLWGKFSEVPSPFGEWGPALTMLVPIIFTFHVMNLFSLGLQMRQDRVIGLLDSCIASRKK